MKKPVTVRIDRDLYEEVKDIVHNYYPKYNSIQHFVAVAVSELINKEASK